MVSSDDRAAQTDSSRLVTAGARGSSVAVDAHLAEAPVAEPRPDLAPDGEATPLLEVRNLKAHFILADRVARAVDGVSFQIARGEIVGLVGESGCGKSVTTQCILRMLPPPGRIIDGEIIFKGADLLKKSRDEMRAIRGRQISIVLQDALAALNPVIPTGEQVADVYMAHRPASGKQAWERAIEMFRRTGIQHAARMVRRYAHELSGGMQQRVVISAAL